MQSSPHTSRDLRGLVIVLLLTPIVSLLLLFATHSTASAAACKQWTGAVSANWSAGGNWSPSGAPGATDCVTINNDVSVTNDPAISNGTQVSVTAMTLASHTLTINGTGSLTLTGAAASAFQSGTITGTGSLNIGGSMTWISGDMTGSGNTTVTSGGSLTIAPDTTSGYAILDTRTLTNASGGTITYSTVSQGYSLYLSGEGCGTTTLVNNGTFLYKGPSNSDPGIDSCGNGQITNGAAATLTKSAGTATAQIDALINNAGSVGATVGVLQFTNGSSSGTGSFTGTAPGKISLQGGVFTLGNGATFSGTSIDGATLVAGTTSGSSNAVVTFSGTDSMTGGTLDGNGQYTFSGSFTWIAGTIDSTGTGTGTAVVTSGATLAITPDTTSGYATLDTRTLTTNAGGAVTYSPVSNGYSFYLSGTTCSSTSFVDNGSFTYTGPNTNDPGIQSCGSPTITIGSTGSFAKTGGSSVALVQPAVNNSGSVSATAGTLQFSNGSTASGNGSFTGTAPGKVSFLSGVFTLGNGASLSGTSIDGGTIVIGTTSGSSNAVVSFNGSNAMTNGAIDGNGQAVINGTLTWVAGGMVSTGTSSGTSVVSAGGILAIAPDTTSGYPILDSRSLTNAAGGTVTYAPVNNGYSWYFGGNSCGDTAFTNNGTFTYTGPNANDPGIQECGTGQITNGATGSFSKTGGSTVARVDPSMDNNGTIAVSAGTLQFQGNFTAYNGTNKLTKGTYNLTSPGVLQFPGAAITNNGANITLNGGSGALIQDTSGGNALANLNTNSGTLTVLNRTQNVKPFTNSGTVVVGPGTSASTLNSSGAYTQTGGSTLLANATSTLKTGGTGSVSINGGTLSGVGSVQTPTSTTVLANTATVSPGSPAAGTGTLAVTGGYQQTSTGSLNVNVAGSPASGSFDQVTANRAISLNGTLAIDSTGYTPNLGDTFTIVSTTAGGISGTFSNVTGTELGNSYYYNVVYNASSVQLVVQARNADVTLTTSSPGDVTADPTNPADNITWTLTVNNLGPAVATGVTVNDTLPAKVQVVSITPSQGSCSTPNSAGVFSCSLGTINPNPGTPPTITIVVKPLDPDTLTNQASVSATQTDPNNGNNAVSDSVTSTAQSGVTYVDVTDSTFSAATSKVAMGKTIQYTFLGTASHHLTDTSGLIDSGSTGPRTFFRFSPQAAGKYVVTDTVAAGANTIVVAPTVKKNAGNGTYTITWSVYGTTPAGYGYDATVTGPHGLVTNLAPTRAEKTTVFTPNDGHGKYTVKVRIRNNATHQGTSFATKKFKF